MSTSIDAQRLDVDNAILFKPIVYRCYSDVEDLGYGSKTRTYVDHPIWGLVNIQSISSKYVGQGLLKAGDAIGVLRYQYDVETTGADISPILIPKQFDEIEYQNRWYRITKLRPAVADDADDSNNDVICWEITLTEITEPGA